MTTLPNSTSAAYSKSGSSAMTSWPPGGITIDAPTRSLCVVPGDLTSDSSPRNTVMCAPLLLSVGSDVWCSHAAATDFADDGSATHSCAPCRCAG